jgi:hypothetical protein
MMEMQQTVQMLAKLQASQNDNQARMETLIDAYHEKRMVMFEAYEKRMMACFGQTEACLEYEEPASGNIKDDRNETTTYNEVTEKIEPDLTMMQSVEEHQDILSEDVAVMPAKGLKKQRRGQKLTAG